MDNTRNTGKLTREELRTYVQQNIDRAVEEGWIRVFYQPVIRTLTEEVSGMEALARWDDPEFGLLSPDDFISALEESRQIHKLDICMIRQICKNQARFRRRDNLNLTVSFNLSRMDFQLCDIHTVIKEGIRKNRLPRDIFRVEITESMMESNEERMRDVIDRFWEYGLRVWMDDFGSGYSSLNVLKDYRFDTLKIDMIFLRNFNLRSREIVKSVVDMAKRIGVHTLAEGVETREQIGFLKSIGCEKAQGYYIGKPQPYEEFRKNLEEKGFQPESPVKRKYYHDIGSVNILSPAPMASTRNEPAAGNEKGSQIPLAFVELSNREIRYLFANDSYLETIHSLGIESTEEIEQDFHHGETSFGEKFLAMMEKAKNSGNVAGTDFVKGKNFCFAQVRYIAGYPGGDAFLCIVHNLSEDTRLVKNSMLTEYMQSLCSIYDGIELIDLNKGYSQNLYRSNPTVKDYNQRPAAEELRDYAQQEVYPEDQGRFLAFYDLDTMPGRLEESPVSFLAEPFRILSTGGNYAWSLCILLFSGDPREKRILSFSRRMDPGAISLVDSKMISLPRHVDEVITPELLWNNHLMKADFGYFWKDRERRFLGVNCRFLSWFGLKSEDEVLGKTSEEMGWHVNPHPYREEEERVLKEGIQTYRTPGTVICHGELRDVVTSRMPIYLDGKIVGLIGYFIDVTDKKTENVKVRGLTLNDPQTGGLNFLALVEAALRYQENYVMENRDFAMLYFDIEDFRSFNKNYGVEWGNALLKAVLEKVRDAVGNAGIAGRFSSDHFIALVQCETREMIEGLIVQVLREISEIESVMDIPCTVYMKVGAAFYSDNGDLEELFRSARRKAKEREAD